MNPTAIDREALYGPDDPKPAPAAKPAPRAPQGKKPAAAAAPLAPAAPTSAAPTAPTSATPAPAAAPQGKKPAAAAAPLAPAGPIAPQQPPAAPAARAADILPAIAALSQVMSAYADGTYAKLSALEERLAGIQRQLDDLARARQQQQPAPAARGMQQDPDAANVRILEVTAIRLGTDDRSGAPTFKAIAVPFVKFGVRIWPEILADLAINADKLKPGDNPLSPPRRMRASVDDAGKPIKIIGLAPGAPADDEIPF